MNKKTIGLITALILSIAGNIYQIQPDDFNLENVTHAYNPYYTQ